MKTKLTVLILLLGIIGYAQNGINYKAVIKDNLGNVLNDTEMVVQFTILESTATGTVVYQEEHLTTTDSNGLVILNIGSDPTPVFGIFEDINWGANQHFLRTAIGYSGGNIFFDPTEFMAVPYALSAANVSGLEKITEGGQTGWRLIGSDPANFGDIGNNAVDISSPGVMPNSGALGTSSLAAGANNYATGYTSVAFGNENVASGAGAIVGGFDSGATGDYAFAIGNDAQASGNRSVAFGDETRAIGNGSFVMGSLSEAINTNASAFGEITLASGINAFASGQSTTASGDNSFSGGLATIASGNYSATFGTYNVDNTNAAFTVGNGTNNSNRSDALTVLKNGNVGINNSNPDEELVIGNNLDSGWALPVVTISNNVGGAMQVGNPTTNFSIDASSTFGRTRFIASDVNGFGQGSIEIRADNVYIGSSPGETIATLEVEHDVFGFFIQNEDNTDNHWELYASASTTVADLLLYTGDGLRGRFDEVSGNYTPTSDARLKTNISPTSSVLANIMNLQPKTYNYKVNTKKKYNGFLAQDLFKIFPEVVTKVDGRASEENTLLVDYNQLIPITIKAIQEQQNIIENQQQQIDELKALVTTLLNKQ
jgi:hypothetical protein